MLLFFGSRCRLVDAPARLTCAVEFAEDTQVLNGEERNMGEWSFFSLPKLTHGLFAGTLTSLTNAYAGCGRHTLYFIERFWLESVRSATDITEMNWNELIKEPQMELKVNCVPVCSGMCSELDSQKFDNAVNRREVKTWKKLETFKWDLDRDYEEPEYSMWLLCQGVFHCLSLYYSMWCKKRFRNLKQSYSLERLAMSY